MNRFALVGAALCFGALCVLEHGVFVHNAFAQDRLTPQAAYDSLKQRGLLAGGGIDGRIMIERIKFGDADAVRYFLAAGVNPNVRIPGQKLPLHVAAEMNRAAIARLLVEAGASPDLTDTDGRTPVQIALQREHDHVVKALLTTRPRQPSWMTAEPMRFEQARVTFHTNLYTALEEAVARYDGDLLIYFYDPGDPASQAIEQTVFGNEPISDYINTHFAPLAVEVGSDTWERLMQKYRPEDPADWPHVVIDLRRSFSRQGFHGWENSREEWQLENILQSLKFAKETGGLRL